VLAERAHWLAANPARYAALHPEGVGPLREFWTLACDWGVVRDADRTRAAGEISIQQAGCAVEPDLLFLSADSAGKFRLRGGALCFPTGWALEEKMGQTLDWIHDVVPGLNASLGSPIQQFLAKLKPGVAWLRDNWGLAATDELNLHPARGVPPPALPLRLDRLWLRVEHQALVALPQSQGIAFAIRIALHRLDTLAGTSVGTGLRRSLQSMPASLAAYKRIDVIRDKLIAQLG
jgi:hypothetical protein